MNEFRIVIRVGAQESLAPVVTLLATAQAQRIGRGRSFAVDGPAIPHTQAAALAALTRMDGVTVEPSEIPSSWTLSGDPVEAGPWGFEEMGEGEADQWWVDSYRNPARLL